MNTKKLLSLLLALVMVLSMAACSDSGSKDEKDEEETIVGTWKTELDMTGYMNEYIASSGSGYEEYMQFEDLKVTVLMTFGEDGSASGSVDEDSRDALAESLRQTFTDGMMRYLEEYFTQGNPGMTMEEALEASGLTKDELLEQIDGLIDTDYMIESLVEGFTHEGEYTVDGNKLYRFDDEDEYDIFELDGDTLTLTERGGSDADEQNTLVDEFYPLVFTRAE